MKREVIRPLAAWDMDVRSTSVLQQGSILSACRMLRTHAAGVEPYMMEFDCAGHHYSCPLFTFQPRTQALAATVENESVEPATAV